MPPELIRSSILDDQKALIVGVANDRSIAWGCAQAMHRAGAEIAMTYLNDRALPHVEPLARAVEAPLLLPLSCPPFQVADGRVGGFLSSACFGLCRVGGAAV